jgi:hypothetical protein
LKSCLKVVQPWKVFFKWFRTWITCKTNSSNWIIYTKLFNLNHLCKALQPESLIQSSPTWITYTKLCNLNHLYRAVYKSFRWDFFLQGIQFEKFFTSDSGWKAV